MKKKNTTPCLRYPILKVTQWILCRSHSLSVARVGLPLGLEYPLSNKGVWSGASTRSVGTTSLIHVRGRRP